MKKIMQVALVVVMLAALFVVPAAAQGQTRSYLLVAQSGNNLPAGLAQKVGQAGGILTETLPQVGLAVAESADPSFKVKAGKISGIRVVLPNLTLQWISPVQQVALDEEFGNPPFSGDDDFFFDLQWGHDAVDAIEAWNAGYRGAGARVAVLDGGFDLDHPDLAPNINLGLSKNFVLGETLQYALPDPFSHGTHTAGTIAAADNAFGTIGIAPEAELVLVKVLGDEGSGTFEDVIAGIVYAADVDADVINMSLGAYLYKSGVKGVYTAKEAAELKNAIGRATTYAYQKGTTVIASAGNSAIDFDHSADLIHIPSDAPNVISISATAPIGWATDPLNIFLDNLASYSNYGQSVIDFGAPGGDFIYPGNESCVVAGLLRPCWVFDLVFSTGNNSWYWSAGTSMAAPHASGVAAIIIGANGGEMHPAQVEAAMKRSADDLGKPGNDDAYGAGRVNAGNAVP
jgi:lantibiotic leader peptide-processing serine protease